jgi:biopolymer transport protein ExbD
VDVVFLLLLFLVLTARFIPREDRFEVRLPEREPPTVEQFLEPYRIAVRVTERGPMWFAAGQPVASVDLLVARLRAVPAGIPVVVVGEDGVPYARVVDAYDAALAADRKRVTLGELGDGL